jgi:hypothetical protein
MRIFISTMAIAICLNACGEFSYKRGASVAQLENTRQACKAKHTDDDIEKCMEDNGWTIQKLDSFEIVTETSANTEEQSVEQANPSDTNKNIVSDEKTTSTDKAKVAGNTKSIKPAKKLATSNPLDTFIVPSWWKTGVKPESFKTDSNACVEKLGEAHKPESKTQTVTYAFIGCMAEKGWKAFKKP